MENKSKINYIIIACCTYKRTDKLKKLLDNLTTINYPKNIKTEILIVDNDKEKSAEEIVKIYKTHYVCETQKGLSNARNKALTTAIKLNASHIAFIDDDEIADINWLVNHIDFYNRFDDIIISSGPTYRKFENDYPDYIVKNKVFKTFSKKLLGEVRESCGSGNVFFPLDIIKKNNIYFSEIFNISGGEDTDFFSRLSKAGFKIGWNLNAVNFEIVGTERANLKWILERAFHNGYHLSLSKFSDNNLYKRILYIIKRIFLLPFELIFLALRIFFGITKFINTLTENVKNFGKLCGAIVMKPNKYYE